MNGLRELQEIIKNFLYEKKQMQQQIVNIEEQRNQLAEQRNTKKHIEAESMEVNELGKQISELGIESQEFQNSINCKALNLKTQANLIIDNLVVEDIRKISILNEEIHDLNIIITNKNEREAKYQLQKQEFYLRFGRMPELSAIALEESKSQEKGIEKLQLEIEQLTQTIGQIKEEIEFIATVKMAVTKGNWNAILEIEEEPEELYIEELVIEEMEPIEEIYVEEFQPIEELYIEEFKPITQIEIEEFKEEQVLDINEIQVDEIEELARSIVEEIATEQTKDYNIIEEKSLEDIITFEQEENEKKQKIIIPLFGQRATISNIIIKFEDENLVYKAQMSDGQEIKIYPKQLGEESVLLRDKKNREECKEILVNYAIREHRVLDKKVISKIDPLVCELLIECAEKYGFNAQELIYNYAESFADGILEDLPAIIYNLSYIEQSNLTNKEKAILNKICRNARKNDGIDMIESFSGFRKIKYLFKRLFAINNVKVLPEAKY